MKIPLTEPTSTRYIRINPTTHHVHLLVPFIAGQDISTDNTCQSEVELTAFFAGGAVSELESYKNTLEFHISLLAKDDAHCRVKEARLAQINTYLEAVIGMRNSYKVVVKQFLFQPSNLYSIQLRPRIQDHLSEVVNPVFTINRGIDGQGTPLSPLYNKMHEIFPTLILGKPDPRTQLITAVLNALPKDSPFETIQDVLAKQCKVPDDFFKHTLDTHHREQVVDSDYINNLMRFDTDTTPVEYVNALLGLCAPNLQTTLQGSPFYLDISTNPAEKSERLSILTQFYLGVMNVYCRAKGISDKNFGAILDNSLALSEELVKRVSQALTRGDDVETTLVTFFNAHKKTFELSHDLSTDDKDAIHQKFEITYRTVTATNENPHMDDFMLLDTEARGKNDIFATHQGLIFTNFANIAPKSPHETYFANIRQEAATHPGIITSQNEPVITVDIEPEALVDKLSDVQWETLPKEVIDACCALPGFLFRQLLDDVAKGKQDEAETILQLPTDTQILLRTPGKFTDYSGRTFHCTAYEYAYWAKDTHMCRMLERHMDDETKTQLLDKINAVERSGLAYQQYGVPYQNTHYDMSFVLKKLSVDEFRQLQTMVGQNNTKIQQATTDNYQSIPFTATEYEQLKITLEPHQPWYITTFFYTSTVKAISDKLQFDFHSLITALETYVNNYDRWDFHKRERAWTSIGKAQRDVPAHIAHEYCRLDRSFYPEPLFNEETLPRVLTLNNYTGTNDKAWYPLTSPSSGPGFDFVITRRSLQLVSCDGRGLIESPPKWVFGKDLAAVRHLDEVRVADLTLSRANLSQVENQIGLGF